MINFIINFFKALRRIAEMPLTSSEELAAKVVELNGKLDQALSDNNDLKTRVTDLTKLVADKDSVITELGNQLNDANTKAVSIDEIDTAFNGLGEKVAAINKTITAPTV